MKERTNRDWSDDPRITAYALGEMEEAERANFEEEIRGDGTAAALVEELRGLGRELEEEFAGESAPGLSEGHLRRIEQQLRSDVRRRGRLMRLAPWGLGLAGLAASVFAVTGIYLAMSSMLGHRTNEMVGTIAGALPSSNVEDSGEIRGGRVIATTDHGAGPIGIDFSQETSFDELFGPGADGMASDSLWDGGGGGATGGRSSSPPVAVSAMTSETKKSASTPAALASQREG